MVYAEWKCAMEICRMEIGNGRGCNGNLQWMTLPSHRSISLSELVSCAFSTIPICPSKNFSFTCLYSFFNFKLHVYYSSANQFPNVRGEYNPYSYRPMYTVTKCVPLFAPVLTAVQILALRMFSHAILPWVRKL